MPAIRVSTNSSSDSSWTPAERPISFPDPNGRIMKATSLGRKPLRVSKTVPSPPAATIVSHLWHMSFAMFFASPSAAVSLYSYRTPLESKSSRTCFILSVDLPLLVTGLKTIPMMLSLQTVAPLSIKMERMAIQNLIAPAMNAMRPKIIPFLAICWPACGSFIPR